MNDALLSLNSVSVTYPGVDKPTVRHANLTVNRGEAFGLIGESGSGKSTLARAIVGLQPISAGEISFAHRGDLASKAQFVFQDSAGALNPRKRAWWLATEPLAIAGMGTQARRIAAMKLFARVGLTKDQLDLFPHAFSGGQRQRLALARALSVAPDLLVLDEPTSALDVSVQAQVLNELLKLGLSGVSILMISHDLSVVAHLCTVIAVMQAGVIVETGNTDEILENPKHPYTKMLIEAYKGE